MSNKETARQVPLSEPQEKESGNPSVFLTAIVSKIPADVKMLAEFKDRHIPDMDQVEVVRTIYPGFDGTLLSKCRNYRKYGVRIRTDALNALAEHFRITATDAPHKRHRKKPNRIQCRLSDALFELLQKRLKRTGQTTQDYLETVILADLQAHAEELRT